MVGPAAIEAIGLVEVDSIASGVEVTDAMLKMAPVECVDAFMVTPGKYVVLVHGDPSSVQSSVERGREVAGGGLMDWLLIPYLHPQVLPALRHAAAAPVDAALGLVETASVAAGVLSADDAAKAAEVQLVSLHLGRGIGGKSILLLGGELHAVQAAVAAGASRAQAAGRLVATRVIPSPHADLAARVRHGVRRLADPAPPPGAPEA
jgi:microcompartment protein CcmL/EutN